MLGNGANGRTIGCVAALIAVAGCASTPTTSTDPAGGNPIPQPTAPPPNAAPYEVHEWGLVRAEPGDVLNAGVVAPPAYVEATADKPILYFHTETPLQLKLVHVRTPSGTFLEAWPPPSVNGDREIFWRSVTLDPKRECTPTALPTAADPPCSLLPSGTMCEAPGLRLLRTEEAACVSYGDATDQFLFYRTRATKFTPPLRFTMKADGQLEVENDTNAQIPGVLIRLWNDRGTMKSMVSVPPAPQTKILVGKEAGADKSVDAPSDRRGMVLTKVGPGLDALRTMLGDLGMTTQETDAFMNAWTEPLFGGAPLASDESLDGDGLRAMPGDSVVYFMPPALIDAVATLEFDPPPRAVKRAFAVWSQIRPNGASR